ncbi:Open rectifier K[+] channel 1 [Carabus blaptoides fortunei]
MLDQISKTYKMMSKRKWTVLLLLFIVYLFLGASFFYKIESEEEFQKMLKEERDKVEIQNILRDHFTEPEQIDILIKLSQYCGKSMINITDDEYNTPPKWDFYHSLFFSITVVTTIGYGNLAPTTSASRIFMIWYGLIGIPINGILFANLGEFFGQIFITLYRKWKNSKVKNYAGSLGLVSQIILYLIPGFAIFIFLPAFVIMHFEKWDYVLSVYYAFVTLTTIGFGDYVAGVENRGFHELYFIIYQIFLVIWIIFGLGYLVMIIGFITRGMRSKKMVLLEKQLTNLSYLRRIMNELYMSKFKPVYRQDCSGFTTPKIGSQSFPDLRKLVTSEISPTRSRRRAFSECIKPLTRVQSDTDLNRIDKEATFAGLAYVQPSELLFKVANAFTSNALDDPITESDDEGGIHGFSDINYLHNHQKSLDTVLPVRSNFPTYLDKTIWKQTGRGQVLKLRRKLKNYVYEISSTNPNLNWKLLFK